MLNVVDCVVHLVSSWLPSHPDKIPLAILLLLRLRNAFPSWSAGGIEEHVWFSAAVLVAEKLAGTDSRGSVTKWADYKQVDKWQLIDAEMALLNGVAWDIWVEDETMEAWKKCLRSFRYVWKDMVWKRGRRSRHQDDGRRSQRARKPVG